MNGSFISEEGIAIIVTAILIPVTVFLLFRNFRSKGFRKSLVDNIAIVYFVFIYVLLLFPFHLSAHRNRTSIEINWIPFKDITDYIRSGGQGNLFSVIQDFLGNLFILMPAGAYLKIKEFKSTNAALCIILFGLSGELPQLIFSLILGFQYRIIDISDVILNTIGAMIGFVVAGLVLKARSRITS